MRNYVVFEQQQDDTGIIFIEVGKVPARNATNALRAAFRELARRADSEGEELEAILAVVPESMWRPTPVRARLQSRVSVSVG